MSRPRNSPGRSRQRTNSDDDGLMKEEDTSAPPVHTQPLAWKDRAERTIREGQP